MKPEQTINLMLSTFPQIFPNKWKCVRHLLFVLGNGYEWINGELVDEFNYNSNIDSSYYDVDTAIHNYFSFKLTGERLLEYPINYIIKDTEKSVGIIVNYFTKEINQSIRNTYDPKDHIEYSKYLKIFNIPTDITLEWKNICIETINIILNNKNNYEESLIKELIKVKNNLLWEN